MAQADGQRWLCRCVLSWGGNGCSGVEAGLLSVGAPIRAIASVWRALGAVKNE